MKKRFIRVLLLCLLLFVAACSFGTALAEGLNVYFLDVGQGNSAFIECDGYTMLIDGGPKDASQYIRSFLTNHNVERIDYMVATHSDLDHVGGLPAALNVAAAGIVFAPDAEPSFSDFKKYLDKQHTGIIVPNAGDTFSLGGASVTVLGPRRGAVYSDNTSLVLRVAYGSTSFLFAGDSEREDEDELIAYGRNLQSTVLCVGHHGSSSSSSEMFLKKVAPQYAVISVGAGNSYGHPHDVVLNRLKKLGITTYRTDLDGQIYCYSDGKTLSITTEGSGDFISTSDFISGNGVTAQAGERGYTSAPAQSEPAKETEESPIDEEATYVGNKKTKKFHRPDCSSVLDMKARNIVYFYGDREEPIGEGYQACGRCKP